MNTPEWLKPGIYGGVIGAVVIMVVGFSWGGWMTSGTANKMARTLAEDEVITALTPVCIEMSRADPDRIAKLATINSAASYKQRDAVIAAGWATVPGTEIANRDLAQACMAALKLEAS
ncbi:hypothetical protein OEZ60_21210 [Defluviimonas sp. WL0024]|uniref:Uncharacterized protein n=2 Tax=Albidovulum TaxID=205889 RepID=A0ABT3JA98_9RHOB|nr:MULTISPECIES: hypothetical protein [Defluviimonas]MCU9850506.1 hypothetical protein [Defluviimonas sp. WL0024]MCW3784601.1 hypothetical protein [Defluviimonas salinarum]